MHVQVIKLSDAVQSLPRSVTEFVHGVPSVYLQVHSRFLNWHLCTMLAWGSQPCLLHVEPGCITSTAARGLLNAVSLALVLVVHLQGCATGSCIGASHSPCRRCNIAER